MKSNDIALTHEYEGNEKENNPSWAKAAVEELIKVAKEQDCRYSADDVSADRLKNAAATKKLAIMDAFEILLTHTRRRRYAK